MAETNYDYSISADITAGDVEGSQLVDEIGASAIVTACTAINTNGDDLTVVMQDALSAGDKTILDGLVLNHVVAPITNPVMDTYSAESAVETSTTSATYTLLDSMSITPPAGKYVANFSCSGRGSSYNKEMDIAIHKDGVIIAESQREMGLHSGSQNFDTIRTMNTQATVTVNGSEAIEVMFRTTGGTFTVYERNLILLKVE
jgi:hypothetical protein